MSNESAAWLRELAAVQVKAQTATNIREVADELERLQATVERLTLENARLQTRDDYVTACLV